MLSPWEIPGGDVPMLLAAGHRYWVGETLPPELENVVIHESDGDILKLAQKIVASTP